MFEREKRFEAHSYAAVSVALHPLETAGED